MIRRIAPLAAVLAGLTMVASACADDVADKATEKSIEKTLEDQTGGDADVDIDGDKVKIETSDGTVEAGTGNLPAGYPEDEVPLVDGEVVLGIAAEGGWQVTIKYDGSPEDAIEAAGSALEAAGVAKDPDSTGLANSGLYAGNGYEVMVSASDAGDGTAVSYFVGKK